MQNSFSRRSVRRWRRGCGGNKKNNFSPFSWTNSTLKKVFVNKMYSNEKFVKIIGVIKKLLLRRLRGRLRRKMADFIFVDMSLVWLCSVKIFKAGVIVSSIAFLRPLDHEHRTILLKVTKWNVVWGRVVYF